MSEPVTPLVINAAKARELLDKAIEEHGEDFVYADETYMDCFYRPRPDKYGERPAGQVGCIVGTGLLAAGIELDSSTDQMDVVKLRHSTALPQGVTMTERAARYFESAQDAQDNGDTWGGAKRTADEWFATEGSNHPDE